MFIAQLPHKTVLALEAPNQVVDNPWWPKLVNMIGKQPLVHKGICKRTS
jgi:hypothetical protein